MKKIIKLILSLLVLFLVFEFIIFIFKNSHEVKYSVKTKDANYNIYEVFQDEKYYFKIKSKLGIYSFDIIDYFNKKKEVIENIYTYKGDDFVCIYPILRDINSDVNIVCSKNNKTYSYTYFEDSLDKFVNKLKKLGYSNPSWEKNSNKEKK